MLKMLEKIHKLSNSGSKNRDVISNGAWCAKFQVFKDQN